MDTRKSSSLIFGSWQAFDSDHHWQVGVEHGRRAAVHIHRSIDFYSGLFQERASLSWPAACKHAAKFSPLVERDFPEFFHEMNGIAEGANVSYADILALNVRTEIAFGLFTDGCTALGWYTGSTSFLAQNWDWMEEQKENVVVLHIELPDRPSMHFVTEAGIIGKIGFNSAGVGVCLNAIKAHGVAYDRLPVHLCLRLVLESEGKEAAISLLEKHGCAASAHLLIADPHGSIGLECTSRGFIQLPMDSAGRVFHTNHLLVDQPGVTDTRYLKDSMVRITRIQELANSLRGEPTAEDIRGLFRDEDGFPFSICRAQRDGSTTATLFSICMNLTERSATVGFGRPTEVQETIVLISGNDAGGRNEDQKGWCSVV